MCEEQNLKLQCINPRGQFSTGEKHGDFYPVCTNTTLEVTPYPTIPQKDEDICTADAWTTFMESTTTATTDGDDERYYDHSFDLTNEKNSGAAFQWSVVDEEKGIIRGRLAFGNVFGWLAIGFAAPGGKHNGMNDGNILMALPGVNYTAQYGLTVPGMTATGSDEISVELAKRQRSTTSTSASIAAIMNPVGSSVAEYHISPTGSSFRHWSEATAGVGNNNNNGQNQNNNNMNVIVTDCFTAMTFETDNINGKFFNANGIDDLMWAGNSQDYHVGYHGRGHRARFYVNWKTGEGTLWTEEDEDEPIVLDHGDDHKDDGHEHDDDDSGGGMNNMQSYQSIVSSILAIVTTASLYWLC